MINKIYLASSAACDTNLKVEELYGGWIDNITKQIVAAVKEGKYETTLYSQTHVIPKDKGVCDTLAYYLRRWGYSISTDFYQDGASMKIRWGTGV